ncbi:hypothetical protein FB645_006103 [Coemansia sp. IMI 203386]|nr:hypothetical protein FB645_006103 [Coemansia sp. IMI 203386]
MSARYVKILTKHNLQLFAGGLLLTTTAGYAWLTPRLERTVELQRRLEVVQRHMYWSMSLTQRKASSAAHIVDTRSTSTQRQAQSWWNAQVSLFNKWANRPGYLVHHRDRAQQAAVDGIDLGWNEAKATMSAARGWLASWIVDVTRWEDFACFTRRYWEMEKSKWQHAHEEAIQAVHPHYRRQEK